MNLHLSSLSIDGDVFDDIVNRSLYSTDASIYQELPAAIIRPKHKNDCIAIVKWANSNNLPLIPRTAGTSIAGQCVGNGVVIDFSKYMTEILSEINERQVTVQPGVILEQLNQFALPEKLKFSQDISTSNRCMMGGMVANNACGSHSVLYGTTREHVVSVEAILSDGSLVKFEPLTDDELSAKCQQNNTEGKIYKKITEIINTNSELLKQSYPKKNIIRRNTGYALDYLLDNQPWNRIGKKFNLAPFICGSEGTLLLITEITVALVPIPEETLMICAHFQSLSESMLATPLILSHKPAAIELIDKKIIKAAKKNIQQLQHTYWIDGMPETVLAIELFDKNIESLQVRANTIIAQLKSQGLGYSYTVISSDKIKDVWAIRKAGLGLLMGVPGDKKAVGIIEDTAVAAEDLHDYIQEITVLLNELDVECVFYGHASVGLLHLRPELNLKDKHDKQMFRNIAKKVAILVKKYNGSLSGEHGDGRLRSSYIESFYGQSVYNLFKEVKEIFDLNNIFNPGKIISTDDVLDNLRAVKKTDETAGLAYENIKYNWDASVNFKLATEKCNGAGVCRKIDSKGVMCPSYQATKEELFSTRGRANLFRQLFQSNELSPELLSGLKKTLDLCLSCKACKSECPANVDISRLKSEFLNLYRVKNGATFKDYFIKNHKYFLKIATLVPKVSNVLLNSPVIKKILGVDQRRKLPVFSTLSLKEWDKKKSKNKGFYTKSNTSSNQKICLLIDVFSQYFIPERAMAVINLCKYFNYEIEVLYLKDSPRMLISQGLLLQAQESLDDTIAELLPMVNKGYNVVGIEPSEILTLKDEMMDLAKTERTLLDSISAKTFLFDEFFLNEIKNNSIDINELSTEKKHVYLHTHCHQKALGAHNATIELLSKIPSITVTELPKGCCGMAGSFGYEHFNWSKKIAEMRLLPMLNTREKDSFVVTTGVSCHHQIEDLMGIETVHTAQILAHNLTLN